MSGKMDAETWATLMIVDTTDKHVLAECVVGLRKKGKNYVFADPPVKLTVAQAGEAGFVVLLALVGKELLRTEYEGERKMLACGDRVTIDNIKVPV